MPPSLSLLFIQHACNLFMCHRTWKSIFNYLLHTSISSPTMIIIILLIGFFLHLFMAYYYFTLMIYDNSFFSHGIRVILQRKKDRIECVLPFSVPHLRISYSHSYFFIVFHFWKMINLSLHSGRVYCF